MRKFCVFVASGFGIGLVAPFAPGTFGSLPGVALAYATTALPLWLQIPVCTALAILAIPFCDVAEKALGIKDDGRITADEWDALKEKNYTPYYAKDAKAYDSGAWYQASRETIEYFMDPRNWLNEREIFMFETLQFDAPYRFLIPVYVAMPKPRCPDPAKGKSIYSSLK